MRREYERGLQISYSPSPLFLKSGDFRGFMGAVSCLESTSLELMDFKGETGERGQAIRNDNREWGITYSNTRSKLMSSVS